MPGPLSSIAALDLLRSIASSTVSATYAAVGTPLTFPARKLRFINNTTADVTISIDGVNDYEFVPFGTSVSVDIGTNRGTAQVWDFPQHTQFFVKGTAGTGTFYIVCYYAK